MTERHRFTTPAMPAQCGDPVCLWPAGATLGEGTCWSVQRQALWWVDILGRQLHQYRPADGQRRSWSFDEEVSAVAERLSSASLVMTLRRGFAAFDPDAAEPSARYLSRPDSEPPGNRFNDGKCDRQGRFWGGTMDFDCQLPTGALHCFDGAGPGARHDLGFVVTNGPTWSLDGRTMFVNDTADGCVHAFDFDAASGALSRQREWLRFAPGDGLPDGMTTDAAGRLWIAHWGGACVSCHEPERGTELGRILLPTSHITNCAFGGPELRTLFITSARFGLSAEQLGDQPLAGGLFAVELDAQGLAASLFGS